MGQTVRLRLPCSPLSPSQARREVAGWLVEFGGERWMDDALLVASELVTNAVLHARTDVEVVLDVDAATLRLEVTDFGEGLPVRERVTAEDEEGRGLNLVGDLSSAWGVEQSDGKTTVWCRLAGAKP